MPILLLIAFFIVFISSGSKADEARLWLVDPGPGALLTDCPQRVQRDMTASSARPLALAARLRWGGGEFSIAGEVPARGEDLRLADHCFALTVNGTVLAAGAILSPYSERLLRFPVLQVMAQGEGDGRLEMYLSSKFPAESMVPRAWLDRLSALRSPADEAARASLAAFSQAKGIRSWPRLAGCGYSPPLGDDIAGLIISRNGGAGAEARWDGACHVPIRHELVDWPPDLPPGRYVIGAVADPSDPRGRTLRVLAVLGNEPAGEPLVEAALDLICARGEGERIHDRGCEERLRRPLGRHEP